MFYRTSTMVLVRWFLWVDQRHDVIRIPLMFLTIVVLFPLLLACLVVLLLLMTTMLLTDLAWLFFGSPRRPGDVLAARWIVLPCAIPGRTLAVRKDMQEAFACSKIGYVAMFYRTLFSSKCEFIPDLPLYKRTGKASVWNGASLTPIAAILIARSCDDPVVAESLGASHLAAYRIQSAWRRAISDPRYKLCKKRLKIEFAELETIVII